MPSRNVECLTRDDVLRAAQSFRAARKMQRWSVTINGRKFPARPLILHAAGVAPNDTTNSHQAIEKLRELGFETHYEQDPRMPPAVAPSTRESNRHAKDSLAAEFAWLATHRESYAGHWVALQGGKLLAADPDAREVFSKVRHIAPPPLVMRVEKEELPFAGW